MHPPIRHRLRTWGVNAALLVGSTGVSVLGAEGLTRALAPQQLSGAYEAQIWRPDAHLGRANRPHVRLTVNTGERDAAYRSDSLGLRVSDPPTPLPPEARRVLLLGDSFAQALMVNAEEAFPGRIEAVLARRGRPVRVLNAGVSNHGPLQYARLAQRLVPKVRPDAVVVVLYAGNDYTVASDTVLSAEPVRQAWRWPRTRRDLLDGVAMPLNKWLEGRSHLFVLLRTRLIPVFVRLGIGPYVFPHAFDARLADSPGWDFTADLALRIRRALPPTVPVLYAILPVDVQIYSSTFEADVRAFGLNRTEVDLDQPQRLLVPRLNRAGVPVIDLLPVLRAAAPSRPPLYGRIDRHLTAAGHAVVADTLARAVDAALSGR